MSLVWNGSYHSVSYFSDHKHIKYYPLERFYNET